MQRIATILQQYAGYLLVAGLASIFYNAISQSIGWNPRGMTGIYALGSSAAVVFVFSLFALKGKSWAGWAGLVLCFLLLCFTGQSLFQMLRDTDAAADKVIAQIMKGPNPPAELSLETAHRIVTHKAAVFGAAFLFSVLTFIKLGTTLRRDKLA